MKKTILLFLGLFVGIFSAFAQMMPDSTYQVCAYWEVGDKYNYQVEESKFKVKNGADTTDIEISSHILTLEIVDATDSTYRVRAKTDDYQNSNVDKSARTDDLIQRFGNRPIEFETNEYGVFKRILLTDEEIQAAYPLLDAIADQTANEQDLDAVARDALKKMMRAMFTKDKIISTYMEEFTPLLTFHGLHVSLDTEVEYETEVPSFLGDGSTIRMKGLLWVDDEWTDEYSIVLHNDLETDKEGMQDFMKTYLSTLASTLGDNVNTQGLEEAEDILQNGEFSRTDSTVGEIHLDTGWPIYYDYEQVVLVKGQGETLEQVKTKTIELILEDKEEE